MSRVNRPVGRNCGVRPNLEALEPREVPAVFTVDTAAAGFFFTQTSLRQAITLAETAPGPDVIGFAASAFDANGNCVIQLDSKLLKITQPLQIVGSVPGMNRPRVRPAAGRGGSASSTWISHQPTKARRCYSATSRSRAGRHRTPSTGTGAGSGR